jgi:hypothetical protein
MRLATIVIWMITLRDPAICESILMRLRFLEARSIRRWGKMSAPEMICHLTDSFRGVLGEKQISPATGLGQLGVVKWAIKRLGLYVSIPWPHGTPTRPEIEQGKGGTPPGEFERDRKDLIAAIQRFRAAEQVLLAASHPMFGRMSFEEWQRWGYLHIDHHLRQFGA